MIVRKKLSHQHFSLMESEMHRKIKGAVWQPNKLYMEFNPDGNDREACVSLFEIEEQNLKATHHCTAVEGGECCWHIAAAHRLLEEMFAEQLSTTDIVVYSRNISYPPPGGKDCTHLLIGVKGSFSKLTPHGILENQKTAKGFRVTNARVESGGEQGGKVISFNRTDRAADNSNTLVEHDDDRWLLSLNLHPVILDRVLSFRKAQRKLLKDRPDALKRIPNLGGVEPEKSSLAKIIDPEEMDSVKIVNYYGEPAIVEEALTPLLFKKSWHPVLLTGNASTGKTVLAYFLARILMLPVTVLSGTMDTNEEKLIGFRDIKPKEEGKFVTVHVPGALLEAIQEGGMLIFNEINVALPEVLSILNDILDWQKRTYVTGVGEVRVAENFRLVATMNPGYIGTTELNLAFSSRFHHMEISYPSGEVLKKIIMEEVESEEEVSGEELDDMIMPLIKIYGRLKQRVESGELDQEVLSIRSFIRAALNLIIRGREGRQIVYNCLSSGVRDENSRQIIKDIVEAFSFE